jgi:hypothetical protein
MYEYFVAVADCMLRQTGYQTSKKWDIKLIK